MDIFHRDESLKEYIKVYPITSILIALNTLAFFIISVSGGSTNTSTLIKFGAFFAPLVQEGEWHRYISSIFLHIGFEHFLLNMFSLYVFAAGLEKILGKFNYLLLYVFSGIGAGIAILVFSPEHLVAGASGAIFGVFGSFLWMSLKGEAKLDPMSAQIFWVILVINLVATFIGSNVSIAGHIGGLLSGVLISFVLVKGKH